MAGFDAFFSMTVTSLFSSFPLKVFLGLQVLVGISNRACLTGDAGLESANRFLWIFLVLVQTL